MGQTLEDSIDQMILEGKDFEACQSLIISTWVEEQHQNGYDILDRYLLQDRFKVTQAEKERLRPELFIKDDETQREKDQKKWAYGKD